jgi:biopolymer transport protein ExbD
MPVKLSPGLPSESEARIEIIPLIDIMFFLLAAFMLVSLSMVQLRSVKVDLPDAAAAPQAEMPRDLASLTVDRAGLVFLDAAPVDLAELPALLSARQSANPSLRVFISGDREARHGDVIRVLDLVRAAGVEKVAFEVRAPGQPQWQKP